jgi:hypothetical protein
MKHPTRKLLLLPAIAVALLSGCVSYGYRDGRGDYYYGQPTTEYSYPYGYGGYGYGGYGYGYPGYYNSPYWGASIGYYGYYGPRRPPRHDGGHGNDHGHGDHGGNNGGNDRPPQNVPDRPRAPWRDLGRLDTPERSGQAEQRQPWRPSPAQAAERAPQQQRTAPRRVEGTERVAPIRRVGGGKRDGRRNTVP